MKIILTGYMGSGKTRVGRLLAQKTGRDFLDLDHVISEEEHKTIPQIFETSGEIYFRRKETEVLKRLLDSNESFILALGGGTPCYGKNLQLMKEAPAIKLIYLQTGLQELKKRLLEERDSRPLIKHLETPEVLEDFIRKHLFERSFYYNQSEMIISTDGKSPEEVSEEILQSLN